MNYLSEIDDPRKPSNGTLHDFREMLVIAVAAVLSDCDTVEDIACWGRAKEAGLRKFLMLTKIVFNMIRLDTTNKTKASLGLKRKTVAWDDDLRIKTLGLSKR